jgi:pyruvate formate lyase activating enzyme
MNRKNFLKFILTASGYALGNFAFSQEKKLTASSGVLKGQAPKSLWKNSKEVYFYSKIKSNFQCMTCPNQCILEPGDRGICRDKVYIKGINKLYNIAYGNPSSINIDPIEKKPLYHFYPGSSTLSIGVGGCPLRCLNCQNWTLSQYSPEELNTIDLFPENVVKYTKYEGLTIISYTYSEPVAWYEYMYDSAQIARKHGLKNVWVTSGYIENEPLKKLIGVIDAAHVDLKSFSDEIYKNMNAGKLKPILNTITTLHKYGIWFELINLIVPGYSDNMVMIKNMCEWILNNIGSGYPLHFTRFFPANKLTTLPPTPVDTLNKAYYIAKEVGLKYVYIGNVPDTFASNTVCPNCKKILIERKGYEILTNSIINGKCKYCNTKIEGRWK